MLASASEEIGLVDPLAALAEVVRAAQGDTELAALLHAGRMYWSQASADVALVGIGAATTIAPSGDRRFAAADESWRALLGDAVVEEAPDTPAPAGLVLLGGFSFDAGGPRSERWRGFPSAHLFVPAVQLTTAHGRSWLTVTVALSEGGEPNVSLELLERVRELVLTADAGRGIPSGSNAARELPTTDLIPADDWRALVRDAVTAIERGEMDKVVLARAVSLVAPKQLDVESLLDHLRSVHRTAYVFGFWRGERAFVGASPERLVRLLGREVDASSLAGSARRGATSSEDAALAAELESSEKDRAEHAMVRTALRDALSVLCDEVRARDEPSLLTLPHIHHLHTAVYARLREGHSLLELAGALHPTPAVGGSPREPALRFIREHERLDRGWYAAPIGWIGRDAGELAVALRSAIIEGAEATLFAGCGIVAASEPDRELAESRVKLRPMQSALAATAARE